LALVELQVHHFSLHFTTADMTIEELTYPDEGKGELEIL